CPPALRRLPCVSRPASVPSHPPAPPASLPFRGPVRRPPPTPPLFPYTTLFRSPKACHRWSWGGYEPPLPNRLARRAATKRILLRSEEHTSELQSRVDVVCRLLLEKKKEKASAGGGPYGTPGAGASGVRVTWTQT